ncbi:MAG: hypothetical protein ACMUIU_15480, partial [bacterium]
ISAPVFMGKILTCDCLFCQHNYVIYFILNPLRLFRWSILANFIFELKAGIKNMKEAAYKQ